MDDFTVEREREEENNGMKNKKRFFSLLDEKFIRKTFEIKLSDILTDVF